MQADKWDIRFLELAMLVRTWSKDPSTQHSTVLVSPTRRVVGMGYNGFPSQMPDKQEYYDNREEKYSRVIHGEMNALMNARGTVEGCIAYVTSGIGCDRCTVHLIQAGIVRFVFLNGDEDYWSRWGDVAERTLGYLNECGIPWQVIDMDKKVIVRASA